MAIRDIYQAVLNLNLEGITDLVRSEIEQGTDVYTIMNSGLIQSMDEVGRRFKEGIFYVPEMLRAAKVMKTGLAVIRPLLKTTDEREKGTIVIGTVRGDLHDIGKNLVTMMIEGVGVQIVDIGVDSDTDAFVRAAEENRADVVALSALLTTTMPAMAETVAALKDRQKGLKIMVGGAPVTREFASRIGADGYAEDAPGAAEIVQMLIKGENI